MHCIQRKDLNYICVFALRVPLEYSRDTLRDTSLLKHITASVLLDTELKHPVSSETTVHIKLQMVQKFNSI